MNEKLLKPYNPQETEDRIYKMWEESGFFNPDICVEKGITKPDAKAFTIMMPPPNVTGVLHMGHALGLTIQDIFIRYKRMNGFKTLWVPGTDHAAIATQSKVEKEIQKKEGKSRHDLGREELLKRVNQFATESHDTIVSQIRVMGASCDWSREAFTLDEQRNKAVRTIFKMMYDDGLIYRGHRIVNWDPKGQTTISDDEIVYEERKSILYTFKYSKDFPIAISTTRPETKVGDTAVAVHPDDPRYKEFIGKEYDLEFCGVPLHIKIVADKEAEMEFGTGALGVTPSHSQIDWLIAERHNLPKKQVINEYAKMMVGDDRLMGKKTTDARAAIVEWLKAEGLMIEEKEITQNISTAERTGGIVEPLPKLQWFMAVNKPFTKNGKEITLKEIMKDAVESGQVNIIPEHWSKTYFHWINNLQDWCISRQIWYGHQVPVWYRSTSLTASQNEEVYVGIEAPEGDGWAQDPDTLDTWFSSGLWSFSTLGWPGKTKDLETFHPTDLIVPGYEILFFWIARMILMTGYALDTIPFKNVYLTGIVRDAKGVKFSKSLGNGIDPIEIANKYGADAGRMAVVYGTAPGTDSKMSDDKIKGFKHFGNKLWNIARFILTSTEGITFNPEFDYTEADKKLSLEQCEFTKEINKEMDEFKLHIVAEKLYQFTWHTLADVILEESKKIFAEGDAHAIASRKNYLLGTLQGITTLLHPFMPFVTEELWSMLPIKDRKLLMVATWPTP
jgi:valyl-tRNA synthetase